MSFSSDAVPSIIKDKLILSTFRAGLREDLRVELLARGVIHLEKAYTLVQDLDFLKSNYNTTSFDSKLSACWTSSSSQFHKSSTQSSFRKNDFKSKNRDKCSELTEQNIPKVSAFTKC